MTISGHEFGNLTSTEIRLLREHRAQKAIEARPPETGKVILRLLRIIRDAAIAGRAIDPNESLWEKIIEIVPFTSMDRP